jgi:hypothetical protein
MAFGNRFSGSKSLCDAFLCVAWILLFTVAILGQSDLAGEERFLYGELDEGTRLFRFVIQATTNDEEIKATLTSLDEGNRKFQLQGVRWDEQSLFFELKETGVSFEGKRSSRSSRTSGDRGLDFVLSPLIFVSRGSYKFMQRCCRIELMNFVCFTRESIQHGLQLLT